MTTHAPGNAPRPDGQPSGDQSTTEQGQGHDTPALQDASKRRGARGQPPSIQSIGDLLRAAYGGKAKRIKPKKAEITAVQSAPKLEVSEKEELLALSALDRTLERTRELMLLSMERLNTPVLAGQVREFVRQVLRRHPAFHSESFIGVLENDPDGPGEEGAVRALTSQSYTELSWPEGLGTLKKKETGQCRANALCCLLLWFRETRGTTFERIQRYLQTNIWGPAASRHKSDVQKLRALMNARDPAGIAVACSALEKQVFEQGRQAAAARSAEEQAVERVRELKGALDGVESELEKARAEAVRLTEELRSARETHENEKAHLGNNYEQLRGRVLRTLRQEVSLLDEGLHALRRDPPKVHVMEDHAERAIEGLKREMERIRGED